MTGSLIYIAPVVILLGVTLLAYAGCGLDVAGTLSPSSKYDAEILNEPSLVSYWRLGETSGTVAHDRRGGHDGTYEGGFAQGAPGLIVGDPDKAVMLDGASAQVTVGFDGALNPAAKFSVEAWASLKEPPGAARTVISSIEGGHRGYAIIAGASTWQAMVGDGSTWVSVDSGVKVEQDVPTHLVLTFNAPTFRLYVEGSDPPGKRDVPFKANGSGPLLIGGAGPDVPAHLHGVVDEVAFYNEELSQIQVGLHFAANGWSVKAQQPSAVTGGVSAVGQDHATVHGTVNPQGQASTYHFDHGTTTSPYSSSGAPQSAGSGSTDVGEQAVITGLVPATTYHYRVVAESPAGRREGLDRQFTTAVRATYPELVVAAGPVSYWRLGETSGTVAADALGTHPGVYSGGVTLGEPGALAFDLNPSVRLNGTSGFVKVANAATLNLPGPLSIEIWIKFRVGGTALKSQAILAKGNTSYRLARLLGTNQITFATTGLSNVDLPSTATNVFNGMWHHVVAVWDGTKKSLYIDGVLDASIAASGTVAPNAIDLTIGQNLEVVGRFWDGWVDEAALYKVALAPGIVAEHFKTGRGM